MHIELDPCLNTKSSRPNFKRSRVEAVKEEPENKFSRKTASLSDPEVSWPSATTSIAIFLRNSKRLMSSFISKSSPEKVKVN